MKITKSELKEMICEALREELECRAASRLKESIWTCFFDDREVGTVEAVNEEEAKEKMMDKYPEYHYGLYDGCYWVEPLTEGAMNGGYAENGSLDTAKRPGGSTSKNKFNALDGKKTKKVLAKDLKPGMVTDTGTVQKVTDIGWMNGKPSVEVSYGGIGNRGSYASDVVAKDREYEVLDESFDESFDAASGATFAIINKYGSGNYSVWYGFALSAEEEAAINDILANHVNEGGSTYGSADEVLSDLNLCL